MIFTPTATISLRDSAAEVEPAEIEAWMQATGLTFGRHGTDDCPWGCGPSSGNPAVHISFDGIACYRCKRFKSWAELIGVRTRHDLYRAARSLVHVAHQRHVLRDRTPFMPDGLIRPAWELIVNQVNADRLADPDEKASERWKRRVNTAASDVPIDVVRSSSGAWIDGKTLRPRRVTADRTLAELPSAFSKPMIDKPADAGPLEGFVPVHPLEHSRVLAPGFEPPKGSVLVRRPPQDGEPPPVDVSQRPSGEQLADAKVQVQAASRSTRAKADRT